MPSFEMEQFIAWHQGADERRAELRRREACARVRHGGRPAPSIRTLPTSSPLPPRGFEHVGGWIDECPGLLWKDQEREPRQFDIREYEGRFAEQFPEFVNEADRRIRDAIREYNVRLLAQWGAMLKRLPEPPEGQAWFPVLEPEDIDSLLTWDQRKAYTTYRLRAELRDA